MPIQPPLAIRVELRDGTPVEIRPVVPSDKERLRRGFLRLSAQSRYRRFGMPVKELTPEQLRHLTEIDYANHMAWIAVDPADPDRPGLGVARYVRLPDEPDVAEAAVVVADPYQGRGLGTVLLGMLGAAATANGIHRFRAYVLTDNRPMLEILRELGGHVEIEEPGMYRVDLTLFEDPEELPDTPTGRVFKAVAKKVLPPPAVLRRGLLLARPS
jgi:RimJ/RimL family protein N-acetyltransferase